MRLLRLWFVEWAALRAFPYYRNLRRLQRWAAEHGDMGLLAGVEGTIRATNWAGKIAKDGGEPRDGRN